MDQDAANLEWLRANTPRAIYAAHGLRKAINVRVVGGKVFVPPYPKDHAAAEDVHFGDFFSVGCQPVISVSLNTSKRRIYVTISGLGIPQPDHRGFTAHLRADAELDVNRVLDAPVYIHWVAVGY